jgi:hypothetical protein
MYDEGAFRPTRLTHDELQILAACARRELRLEREEKARKAALEVISDKPRVLRLED